MLRISKRYIIQVAIMLDIEDYSVPLLISSLLAREACKEKW